MESFKDILKNNVDKEKRIHFHGHKNEEKQSFKEFKRFSQVTFMKICNVYLDVRVVKMFMNKLATVQFVKCINSAENIKTLSLYYSVDYSVNLDNLQYLLATIQVETLEIEQQDWSRMGSIRFYEPQTTLDHFKKFVCYYKAARVQNKSVTWKQYICGKSIKNIEDLDELFLSYSKDLITFCARNKITILRESELFNHYEYLVKDKVETFKNDVKLTNEEVIWKFGKDFL